MIGPEQVVIVPNGSLDGDPLLLRIKVVQGQPTSWIHERMGSLFGHRDRC